MKIISIILIFILVSSLAGASAYVVSEKQRCSDTNLKKKIFSFQQDYTEKEKIDMLPAIRNIEGCK